MANLKNKLKINKVTTLNYQINFRFIIQPGGSLPNGSTVYVKLKPRGQKGTDFLPVVCDGLPKPFFTDTAFDAFKLLIKVVLIDEGTAGERGDTIESNIVRYKFASLADYNPDLPIRVAEIRQELAQQLSKVVAPPTVKTIIIGSGYPFVRPKKVKK